MQASGNQGRLEILAQSSDKFETSLFSHLSLNRPLVSIDKFTLADHFFEIVDRVYQNLQFGFHPD
jgi:hypothetical protein